MRVLVRCLWLEVMICVSCVDVFWFVLFCSLFRICCCSLFVDRSVLLICLFLGMCCLLLFVCFVGCCCWLVCVVCCLLLLLMWCVVCCLLLVCFDYRLLTFVGDCVLNDVC